VRERAAEAMKELEKKIRLDSYQPPSTAAGVPIAASLSADKRTGAITPKQMLEAEDEEQAKRLAQLSKLSDIQYATDRIVYQKTAAEFRSIGEQLCANGGDERMKRIALRMEAFGGRQQDCEIYWAGICGWVI